MRNENKFYASLASDLFKSKLSNDVINLYKRYKENSLGMTTWGDNGELVTMDEDLMYEVQQYLNEHPTPEFYDDKSKEISLSVRALCAKHGEDAIGMETVDMDNKPVIITPKMYQAVQKTNKDLYSKPEPITPYNPQIERSAPDDVQPNAPRETRMHSLDDVFVKTAGLPVPEDYAALTKSYDEERYPGEFVDNDAKAIYNYFTKFQSLVNSEEPSQEIDVATCHSMLVDKCNKVIEYANSRYTAKQNQNELDVSRSATLVEFYKKVAEEK
jgi:hypothetical protein